MKCFKAHKMGLVLVCGSFLFESGNVFMILSNMPEKRDADIV